MKNVKEEKYKAYQKEYRKQNKAYLAEYRKQYYKNNKEKVDALNLKSAKKCSARVKEYGKQYYAKNKQTVLERLSKYRALPENKERARQYSTEWYQNNKKRRNQQERNRYKNNEFYKTTRALRSVVRNAFKRIGKNKPTKTENIMGCSWKEAKQHIEQLWQEGMTWENYGKWHIDHIRPVSSFKDVSSKELKQMNEIKNLQPLWAKDNITKSDHY